MSNCLIIKDMNEGYLYQGPRFRRLGPNSGEQFREEVLIPFLKDLNGENGFIDFVDTRVFSPSFLEECFGGAVRSGYGDAIEKLSFINIPEEWKADVLSYIREAIKKKK